MFRRIAVAAVAVCLTTFAIAADAAFTGIDKGHVKIEGVAKPGLGAFSGELQGVDVKEADGKLIFSADLGSRLKMGLRQSHCKEAFQVDKHKSVTLTVDNTGEVLSPQLVATLTEPFQRGTERIRNDHAGVGLGLAIASSIFCCCSL